MSAYHLAPSLAALRAEVNAAWPRRDKASDGWIGDTAHGARKSDHNPDYAAGGVVRALDIDKDGVDVDRIVRAAIADDRTAYVIWNRRIWTRGVGWSNYTGTNGHTAHVHVSIRHGKGVETSTAPWGVLNPRTGAAGAAAATIPTPTPQENDMIIFRKTSTGEAIFVCGGVGMGIYGPPVPDYGNFVNANIEIVGLSDVGFALAKTKYGV